MGLREQITQAKTVDEINDLLEAGLKYEYASSQTRSAWTNTAKRRIKELDVKDAALVEVKKAAAKTVNTNKKPKKKKNNA